MPLKLFPGETAESLARFTTKTQVTGAAVVDGGSGYAVDDILRVVGGEYYPDALLKVATLSGSAVATVTVDRAGQYLREPADPVDTVNLTGSGSGATFNLTTAADAIPQANIVNIEHRRSTWYLKYWE